MERTRGRRISVARLTAFSIVLVLLLAPTACGSSPGPKSADVGPQAPDVVIRLAPSATDEQISDLVGTIVNPAAGPPHVSYRVDYEAREILLEWYDKSLLEGELAELRKQLSSSTLVSSVDRVS